MKTVKTDQVDHSDDEDSSFELIVAEELVYTGKTHLAKGLANLKSEKIKCCRSEEKGLADLKKEKINCCRS